MTCTNKCDALPLARVALLVSRFITLLDDGVVSFDAHPDFKERVVGVLDDLETAVKDVSDRTLDAATLHQRLQQFALSCATTGHPQREAACHALGLPLGEPSNHPTPAGA